MKLVPRNETVDRWIFYPMYERSTTGWIESTDGKRLEIVKDTENKDHIDNLTWYEHENRQDKHYRKDQIIVWRCLKRFQVPGYLAFAVDYH